MDNNHSGKVAVVTGTSTGVGLYTAVQLAQAGFTVVATMRDTAKAGSLVAQAEQAGVKLDLRQLDVQDSTSIIDCIGEVFKAYGRIDLLVNNAGAGYLGSLEQVSPENLRRTMEVNFFGVWQVTQAVFPLMRVAGSGHIISVTSVGGLIGQPFNDAYCAAKFAVEGFMESLAPVAKGLGIAISLIEPGPINTEFVASAEASRPEIPQEQSAYMPMLDAYIAATRQVFSNLGQTPQEVGQVIVEAATATQPHLRYVTSATVQGLVARKYVDPSGDSILALTGSRLPSPARP